MLQSCCSLELVTQQEHFKICCLVTFWFQVIRGRLDPWSLKFRPSPLCSQSKFQRRVVYTNSFLSWRGSHPFNFLLPNPSVRRRGHSTRSPRFEKRAPVFSFMSLLSCGSFVLVAFHLYSVAWRFREQTTSAPKPRSQQTRRYVIRMLGPMLVYSVVVLVVWRGRRGFAWWVLWLVLVK